MIKCASKKGVPSGALVYYTPNAFNCQEVFKIFYQKNYFFKILIIILSIKKRNPKNMELFANNKNKHSVQNITRAAEKTNRGLDKYI